MVNPCSLFFLPSLVNLSDHLSSCYLAEQLYGFLILIFGSLLSRVKETLAAELGDIAL
jgi:hypothetical protein